MVMVLKFLTGEKPCLQSCVIFSWTYVFIVLRSSLSAKGIRSRSNKSKCHISYHISLTHNVYKCSFLIFAWPVKVISTNISYCLPRNHVWFMYYMDCVQTQFQRKRDPEIASLNITYLIKYVFSQHWLDDVPCCVD